MMAPRRVRMTQALKTIGVLALLLLIGGEAAASPILSGRWRGELGNVRLQTRDGVVTGHYESGGRCDFLAGQRVLEAHFEGNVLVGKVSLCQQGAACREKVYSVLAFYDPDDGSLSAHVRLDEGCSSPALKHNRVLTLQAPEAGSEDRGSALAVARTNQRIARKSAQLAERHFTEGRRLLESKDFRGAKAEYEAGLSYHEDNVYAYIQLGVIQMQLDNPPAALDAYRKASALKPTDPLIAYNMACAYARLKDRDRALDHLKVALRKGFGKHPDDAKAMSADKDLSSLLANDPEYKALLDKVWELSARARRGR